MEDGQDIFNEFLFWREVALIENHEFCSCLLAKPLNQWESESNDAIGG